MTKQQFTTAAEYINQSPDPFALTSFLMTCEPQVFWSVLRLIEQGAAEINVPTVPDHLRISLRTGEIFDMRGGDWGLSDVLPAHMLADDARFTM